MDDGRSQSGYLYPGGICSGFSGSAPPLDISNLCLHPHNRMGVDGRMEPRSEAALVRGSGSGTVRHSFDSDISDIDGGCQTPNDPVMFRPLLL